MKATVVVEVWRKSCQTRGNSQRASKREFIFGSVHHIAINTISIFEVLDGGLLVKSAEVERLNRIIRVLQEISSKCDCVLMPIWLSTHDNIGADALSRDAWDTCVEWFENISSGGIRLYRWRDRGPSGSNQSDLRVKVGKIRGKN